MFCRETVRNRFRGWHHWTVFPVLLTPADQRQIIIMIKYKLLFTVDISLTDKGVPLATLHFVHTNSRYIITTENKNRTRIKNKINTSFSNYILYTISILTIQWPSFIYYWIPICTIWMSYLTLNFRWKINSILLINVNQTRFMKR
jgi:hypothetical protein